MAMEVGKNNYDECGGMGTPVAGHYEILSGSDLQGQTEITVPNRDIGGSASDSMKSLLSETRHRTAFEVVQAVPADAEEIGALRAHNWKEQYAHLDGVTEEWMDAEVKRLTSEEGNRSRAHWIDQAARPDAKNYWLVVRAGSGALAGFLEARRHDDNTQELRSLHLAPDQRGMGIGQALMDVASRDWFDPTLDTFLDVAKVNEAGQRFYARSPNNFERTEHTFFYGPVAMLQMKRKAETRDV